MYVGLSRLAAWEHTRTKELGGDNYTSPAGAGEAHNDWRYDAARGGWVYTHPSGPLQGQEQFVRGGPMDSHGGWDWAGSGSSPAVVTDMQHDPATDSAMGPTWEIASAGGGTIAGVPIPVALGVAALAWYLLK